MNANLEVRRLSGALGAEVRGVSPALMTRLPSSGLSGKKQRGSRTRP